MKLNFAIFAAVVAVSAQAQVYDIAKSEPKDSRKEPAGALSNTVFPDNIRQTICLSDWMEKVALKRDVAEKTKIQLMKERGIRDDQSNYILDYLVPLELGGSATDHDNLWPMRISSQTSKNIAVEAARKYVCQLDKTPMNLDVAQGIFLGHHWQAFLASMKRYAD